MVIIQRIIFSFSYFFFVAFRHNDMQHLVNTILEHVGDDTKNLELECAIGNIMTDGTFVAGVPFAHFRNTVYALNTGAGARWDKPLHEKMMTCSFPDYKRMRFVSKTPTEYIMKKKLWVIDVACDGHPLDFRVSCSMEIPCAPFPPNTPSWYRLQERWSFVYDRFWRYDLTKVAGGVDKISACKETPVYEVELELDLASVQLDKISTETLLQRSLDVMGRFDSSSLPIPTILRPGAIKHVGV